MTSLGIGLRSRQVPPREDIDSLQGVIGDEDSEEGGLVQRVAYVPPQQHNFEDAVLFSELDSMENVLSSGDQSAQVYG
jgi:hypothetical protein